MGLHQPPIQDLPTYSPSRHAASGRPVQLAKAAVKVQRRTCLPISPPHLAESISLRSQQHAQVGRHSHSAYLRASPPGPAASADAPTLHAQRGGGAGGDHTPLNPSAMGRPDATATPATCSERSSPEAPAVTAPCDSLPGTPECARCAARPQAPAPSSARQTLSGVHSLTPPQSTAIAACYAFRLNFTPPSSSGPGRAGFAGTQNAATVYGARHASGSSTVCALNSSCHSGTPRHWPRRCRGEACSCDQGQTTCCLDTGHAMCL